MNRKSIFLSYLLEKKIFFIFLALSFSIYSFLFFLRSIDSLFVLYASFLIVCLLSIYLAFDYRHYYKKVLALEELQANLWDDFLKFPPANNFLEEKYQEIVLAIKKDNISHTNYMQQKEKDTLDYFTLWIHQIKTPIAAIDLLLKNNQHPKGRELKEALFQIENYSELALAFLRVESLNKDLRLKKTSLEKIVRESVKKHSALFINKKISLKLENLALEILTDEKWFEFALDQIIFNALKYTEKGEIKIHTKEEGEFLVIADSGVGILDEDLPRIFERGFTGLNGRMDKKASGLGLPLVKKILSELGHEIYISSKINQGTQVFISLKREKLALK